MSGRTSRAWAVALEGLGGHPVEVEAHVASGLPRFVLIGLPDASLGEARDRIRAALNSTGQPLPLDRVTVNLSPAAMRKHGSGFDLAIAASILAATGVIDAAGPARCAHLGELALTGAVRPVAGVLPAVAAARAAGLDTVLVPAANAAEAALVEGMRVVPISSLRQLALHYGADADLLADEPDDARVLELGEARAAAPHRELADAVGMDSAVRAAVVAAAGRHHLLLHGPPGSGKTMLAERLPGILPDLDVDTAIEVAALRSLRGEPIGALDRRPPFEAPHHTASAVALIGGGSGEIRPGAISLAAHGVLLLDEAPEFPRRVLDALRQPLESGSITVHRARQSATFPANAQLVLGANPCPCGYAGVVGAACTCTAPVRRGYLQRLSGPLLDRIDLQVGVEPVTLAVSRLIADGAQGPTSTAAAAAAVIEARERARRRLAGTPWITNSEVDGAWLRRGDHRIAPGAATAIDGALRNGTLTMRGATRTLRVAWTLADLDGADRPTAVHIGAALVYRDRLVA